MTALEDFAAILPKDFADRNLPYLHKILGELGPVVQNY